MTPAEWFAATDPDPMGRGLPYRSTDEYGRRRRLFGCACARQVWHLLPTDARSAVQVSERLADGHATETDMRAAAITLPRAAITPAHLAITAAAWASAALHSIGRLAPTEQPRHEPWEAARVTARALASEAVGPAPPGPSAPLAWHRAWTLAYDAVRATQAAFVRDIFPPPGYTPHLEAAWLTSTVVDLARHIDDSGDFSITPILGDALQDAGCEDETVLQCCRAPNNVHIRGNWVVDLVQSRV